MHAVVALGGAVADSPLVRARVAEAALRIGADGGTTHLLTLGLRPDVVTGDLDSLAEATLEALRRSGVEVAPHPAPSRVTDGQVALELALARGATEIVVLGASGGERLDHGWALALVLLGPALRAVPVTLVDGWSECVGLHEAGRRAVTFRGRGGRLRVVGGGERAAGRGHDAGAALAAGGRGGRGVLHGDGFERTGGAGWGLSDPRGVGACDASVPPASVGIESGRRRLRYTPLGSLRTVCEQRSAGQGRITPGPDHGSGRPQFHENAGARG